jgi:hypothetical protein
VKVVKGTIWIEQPASQQLTTRMVDTVSSFVYVPARQATKPVPVLTLRFSFRARNCKPTQAAQLQRAQRTSTSAARCCVRHTCAAYAPRLRMSHARLMRCHLSTTSPPLGKRLTCSSAWRTVRDLLPQDVSCKALTVACHAMCPTVCVHACYTSDGRPVLILHSLCAHCRV